MEIYHCDVIDDVEFADYLRDCINKLSNQSHDSESLDEDFTIDFIDSRITPTVISLLVQILNQPLPQRNNQNGNYPRWDWISLHGIGTRNCSDDDLQVLFSALMGQTQHLIISFSPQIFAFLTRITALDQLDVNSLTINQRDSSSLFNYARLGDMIQRSSQLTKLDLLLDFCEVPHEMFESLSNAIQLQELTLRHMRDGLETSQEERKQILSHLVVDEHGHGVVARLLQNPQCRLQYLDLSRTGLEDHHFTALAHLLHTSHLKYLDVADNNIQAQGIMEFALQLPKIQTLKTMVLLPNPWLPEGQCSSNAEECGVALVRGMMENYSVEYLKEDRCSDPLTLEDYPQSNILMHLADLNRAGRRVLASDTTIPRGLWPCILERAGTTISYRPRYKETAHVVERLPGTTMANAVLAEHQPARKANTVFFFLQNCPIFWDELQNPIEENTTE